MTTNNTKLEDKNLLGETDPKLDAEAREKLIGARVGLLLKTPFFGNMATRLRLENADEWCSTAATDGRKFYYNSRFVNMLSTKELEFLFGHEVLHCCYDHFGRKDKRDHRLWNIANDYAVNDDLIKHNVGTRITTVAILHDPKFRGMASEEIYDQLLENAEKIDIDVLMDMILDEHLDVEGEGTGGGGEQDGEGQAKGKPKISKDDLKEIRNELKEAMLSAAETSGAGDVPGGVKRLIKSLTEPKMDWRELLRQQLTSTIKTDFSWMRPSRRGWHTDSVMPGMTPGEMVDIAIAIDTSGSISETMLRDFLSEIKGITEEFACYRVHLFTFDTKVYNPQVYTNDNMEDITEYDIQGCGGTDFVAIFDYLKEEQVEPERLVVFTDGYPCRSWGDPDYCDTLWIVHGSRSITAPFGLTARYEPNK